MKILILECTAEELKANKTVMDNVLDAINSFVGSFSGVNLSNSDLLKAISEDNSVDEQEETDAPWQE